MKYKSVGLALAGMALACGGWPAAAANMMEIGAFTTGLAVSDSGGYKLKSTVGEVSGSTIAASGKGLRTERNQGRWESDEKQGLRRDVNDGGIL